MAQAPAAHRAVRRLGGPVALRWVLLATLLSVSAASCASDEGDGSDPRAPYVGADVPSATYTVNDGVPVVSYGRAALEALPTFGLADQPRLTFGVEGSPPLDMQGVRAVRPLAGGAVAALDRYLPAIYVFGESGRLLTTLGRSGDGPGEFRTVHTLAVLPGDSLAVLDQYAARLTVFGLDGGVRTAQMPAALPTRFARLMGSLATGELVVSSVPTIRPPTERERERLPLELAILDSTWKHREILTLPDFEVALQLTRFSGRPGMTPTWVRLAARANVRVLDSLIAVTTGDEFLVRLHDRTGLPVMEIRVDAPPRRVTESMRDAQIASDLDVLHNVMREPPVHIEESERIIREAPYAEWLPVIDGLVDSNDGLLWVLNGSAPTDSVWSALAFETSGALIRRAQGPAEIVPVLFRVGDVVVRTINADGLVGFESRAYRRLE